MSREICSDRRSQSHNVPDWSDEIIGWDDELESTYWRLVEPLRRIESGDRVRFEHDGGDPDAWFEVDEDKVGEKVPYKGWGVCRMAYPHGYRKPITDEVICDEDVIWTEDGWLSADKVLKGKWIGSNVRPEVDGLVVAKRDLSQLDSRAVKMPELCRLLVPGVDCLRRGDLMIAGNQKQWTEIGFGLRGQSVKVGTEKNGWIRCCRKVSELAQVWWVCEKTGDERNLGGYDDPWPSEAVAKTNIKAAEQVTGEPAEGVIRSKAGEDLLWFDGPEREAFGAEAEILAQTAKMGERMALALESGAVPPEIATEMENDEFIRQAGENISQRRTEGRQAVLEQAQAALAVSYTQLTLPTKA